MNRIYDNGALMLGNVQDIIAEVEYEIKKDIDMVFTDKEDLLKDLKEIRDLDYDAVVYIDYENPMGYTINYWLSNDIVKERQNDRD